MKKLLIGGLLFVGLSFAQTQTPRPPLVSCEAGKNTPCVVLASKPADLAGIWKRYQNGPAFAATGGVGFVRYNSDGSYATADTPENTAAQYKTFPYGTISFEGNRMTIDNRGAPASAPECAHGVYEVRVIRLGDQPIGMNFNALEDTCKTRLSDTPYTQIYISPAR